MYSKGPKCLSRCLNNRHTVKPPIVCPGHSLAGALIIGIPHLVLFSFFVFFSSFSLFKNQSLVHSITFRLFFFLLL